MRVSEARKRDHDESIALALSIEQDIHGMKATTVIFALCWVLASLILQGDDERHIAPGKAIAMIAQQIRNCVKVLKIQPKAAKGVH